MTQTPSRSAPSIPQEKIPLWRDDRVVKIVFQVVVVGVFLSLVAIALNNLNANLAQLGRGLDFGFLGNRAGFNIGETILPYNADAPYWWGLWVGLVNTLRLCVVSMILATVVGVLVGIASFSDNWLLRKLSVVYVEVLRNIPPLLQFFFWYVVVFFGLSKPGEVTQLSNFLFVSKKGISIPWPAGPQVLPVLAGLVGVAIAALILWLHRLNKMETQGASGQNEGYGLLGLGVLGLILAWSLGWQFPRIVPGSDVVQDGLRLSLEYSAMMVGLAAYVAAFIAEIVRAGIQSVPKGQWEAARALGISDGQLMRLVVFPQALRVILPSLNSQYATLIKNSSLALAIGYPDISSVAQTTLNQSGRAIEVVLLMIGVYLGLNAIVSVVMNLLNGAVQVRER
jgi:general L-amino acid transport system permease protein